MKLFDKDHERPRAIAVDDSLYHTLGLDPGELFVMIPEKDECKEPGIDPWRPTVLNKVEDRNGNKIELTYKCDRLLEEVKDGTGRRLAFSYEKVPTEYYGKRDRLTRVDGPIGDGSTGNNHVLNLEYGKEGYLSRVSREILDGNGANLGTWEEKYEYEREAAAGSDVGSTDDPGDGNDTDEGSGNDTDGDADEDAEEDAEEDEPFSLNLKAVTDAEGRTTNYAYYDASAQNNFEGGGFLQIGRAHV